MRKLISLTVFLFVSATAYCQDSTEIKIIDPINYAKAISGDVQLVDVRTAEEYEAGHIEEALNIDFFAENFLAQFEDFDKTIPIYIYCRSGNRSGKATKKLKDLGFSTIIDLKGGFKAWKEFNATNQQ